MSKAAKESKRYEVITQEDPETGDIIIPIPPPLLKEMGWKEGDEIDVNIDDKGRVVFKKV